MQTELIRELNQVLKAFPQFWNGEKLRRSIVVDAINKKEPEVIKALIVNEKKLNPFMEWMLMEFSSSISASCAAY